MQKRQFITMLSGAMLTGVSGLTRAQGAGIQGVTDSEIKIGTTLPLSGPAAGYGAVGKAMSAWFVRRLMGWTPPGGIYVQGRCWKHL